MLTEFDINISGPVPAGQVDVKIDNRGAEMHEVVIVAAENPTALPRKADGSVDEDKIPSADKIGESGDIPAQTAITKSFAFEPGTYVAFCNIVDDMAMTGTTAMSEAHGDNMQMDGGAMGDSSNTTMMGATGSGHVHFAQGMSTTFTVK